MQTTLNMKTPNGDDDGDGEETGEARLKKRAS